jgi:hypothetical protein
MAITYERRITDIQTKDMVIDGQTLSDCIVKVSWEHKGTDENGVEGIFYGTMSWDSNPDRFISTSNHKPFINVSEQDVWNWIDSRTTELYAEHQKQIIQNEINRNTPATSQETFPWS